MKKKSLLFGTVLSLTSLSFVFGQTDIADARSYAVGSSVTITGVASDGGELGGSIRYIQDLTGGIPIYGYNFVNGQVSRGDSVTVTGILKDFGGLLEIDPITNLDHHGPGTEIAPWNINMVNMNDNNEGRLVRIDNVTFDDAGSSFGNGQNYQFTDGVNTSKIRINSGTGLGGQTIPSGSQTIVGLLSEYNGAFQLLPRGASDIFGYVAPAIKIEVSVNGVPRLNGATIQIGTNASTPIEIKNTGTGNLIVSSIDFSGSAAGDFSTTVSAGTIASASNINGTIGFSTSSNGSLFSTLTISSDDPDNPNFTLNLYGIGIDGLATQPANGPTNLAFSNIEAYKMNVEYTASPSAEGYLVIWKKGSTPTTAPTDGTQYKRGDMIGDGKVAYVGNSSSVKPRGIRANTDYHFKVYAMNGYGNYINYNQNEVLAGNQISKGNEIGNYYQGISSSNPTLIEDLTALINPHTVSSYFLYKSLMMEEFEVMDTTGGRGFVTCAYSGERKVFDNVFDWTETGYSREHTYAHSWFPTFPANEVYGQEKPEYLDYHNLYPVNHQEANSPRSNLPFGEVVGTPVYEYLEGKRGTNGQGVLVYEPRDKNKGNVARAIFYMATAYNGENGTGDDWSIPSNQNQEVLKNWHFQDLPDNYEIARNELIYSIQENRNPYIDSVDFACYVNFHGMTFNQNGCEGLSLTPEFIENNLSVFPNPSNDVVYIQLNGIDITAVKVLDITGRVVGVFTSPNQFAEIDVTSFKSGTYLLNIQTENGTLTRKVIVQ